MFRFEPDFVCKRWKAVRSYALTDERTVVVGARLLARASDARGIKVRGSRADAPAYECCGSWRNSRRHCSSGSSCGCRMRVNALLSARRGTYSAFQGGVPCLDSPRNSDNDPRRWIYGTHVSVVRRAAWMDNPEEVSLAVELAETLPCIVRPVCNIANRIGNRKWEGGVEERGRNDRDETNVATSFGSNRILFANVGRPFVRMHQLHGSQYYRIIITVMNESKLLNYIHTILHSWCIFDIDCLSIYFIKTCYGRDWMPYGWCVSSVNTTFFKSHDQKQFGRRSVFSETTGSSIKVFFIDTLTQLCTALQMIVTGSELSTGRMDPRVGSGHDFAGFWRVGSGQHFGFLIFYWLFLGTWIDMNLRILHSDWLIFYDI